ncbi:hypothetical protein QQ045_004737 [Rhodiola kirilowii]
MQHINGFPAVLINVTGGTLFSPKSQKLPITVNSVERVLSNPEKNTFICKYDLSDMPAGTKAFLQQKTTLASQVKGDSKSSDILNQPKPKVNESRTGGGVSTPPLHVSPAQKCKSDISSNPKANDLDLGGEYGIPLLRNTSTLSD